MPKTSFLPRFPRATVAMGFVAGMLSGMAARGQDPRPLLLAADIDPDALARREGRVPLDGYAHLYNLVVSALKDEGFGLFRRPVPPGSFEFLCRSVVASRSLGEALDRMGRFLALVLQDMAVEVCREAKGNARIIIREIDPVGDHADDPRRIFALEWLLRVVHGLSCWLVGRSLPLLELRCPYAPPAHAADYALIYTESTLFHAGEMSASLPDNFLDLSLRRDEEALQKFLEGAPGKISLLYRRDREAVRMVRDLLLAAFPESPGFDEVAGRLYLSSRTLHRRLGEEGSSFRLIKDALRRDLAIESIEKGNRSVSRIAAELGFADNSAFFRAFRKWTGEAPSRYKRRLD